MKEMRLPKFLFLAILAFLFGNLHSQNPDSINILLPDGTTLLSERDILSWKWEFQAIVLTTAGKARLESIELTSTTWLLRIGKTTIYTGYFLDRQPVESATDSAFIIPSPQRRVRVPNYNTLILWYFPSGHQHTRNLDWRINPLFNPLLLSHLLSRNLIPADYRMRFLLGRIGLGLVAKGIERP